MKAKYIIQSLNSSIEFKADKLNFTKCSQIAKLASANKKWKGYVLQEIEYGINGLTLLNIRKL